MEVKEKIKEALYENRKLYALLSFEAGIMGGCGNEEADKKRAENFALLNDHLGEITWALDAFERGTGEKARLPSIEEFRKVWKSQDDQLKESPMRIRLLLLRLRVDKAIEQAQKLVEEYNKLLMQASVIE